MSALSSNLSELDQLLQDLNSAQFMAEVDKRNSGKKFEMTNGFPDIDDDTADSQNTVTVLLFLWYQWSLFI